LSERIREIEATGIVIDRVRVKVGKKHYTRYSYHKAFKQAELGFMEARV
jgi:hypothetical protein